MGIRTQSAIGAGPAGLSAAHDLALLAYLQGWTGQPQGVFWVIGALALLSLVWLHLVVRRMGPAEARQI